MQELLKFYEGSKERVGFVLRDGSIVEVENICDDPENGFEVRGSDLLKYYEDIVATWHTHPDETSSLSQGDKDSFLNYREWTHHIVGSDGISTYKVEAGRVVLETSSIPARLSQEDL